MHSPNSRFGRQPVADILKNECGWSVRFAAKKIGVPEPHLVSVVHGRSAPSPRVREALPGLVGRPLEELFTADSLAGQYLPQFGPGGPSRRSRRGLWAVATMPDNDGTATTLVLSDHVVDAVLRFLRAKRQEQRHVTNE